MLLCPPKATHNQPLSQRVTSDCWSTAHMLCATTVHLKASTELPACLHTCQHHGHHHNFGCVASHSRMCCCTACSPFGCHISDVNRH